MNMCNGKDIEWSVVQAFGNPRLFEVKGQSHSLFPMSCFSTCTDAAADTFLRSKNTLQGLMLPPK